MHLSKNILLIVFQVILGVGIIMIPLNANSQDSIALEKELRQLNQPEDSIEQVLDYVEKILSSRPEEALSWIRRIQPTSLRLKDQSLINKVNYQEAIYYRNMGQRIQAIELLSSIKESYKSIGNRKGYADLCKSMAEIEMRESLFEEAKMNYDACIEIYQELQDTEKIAYSYRGLNSLYRRSGDLPKSLEYGLKALDLFKEIGHEQGESLMHNSLGLLYSMLEQNEQAKYHFQKSLDYAIKTGDKIRQTSGYRNLAYITKHDEKLRLSYYEKSYELDKEMGRKRNMAMDLFDIGISHKILGNYSEALANYQQSKSTYEEAGIPPHSRLIISIGEIFSLLGQPDKAKPYLEEGIDQLQASEGEVHELQNSYGLISKVYRELNDFEQAYHFKVLQKNLADSLLSVDKNTQLAEMETTYKVKEKDLEITRLEQVEKLQSRIIALVAGVLLLISVLAFILYRNNQNRKKTNQLLSAQKSAIEQRNAENETLLREIHHRVKNNLQVISALLTLQSSYVQDEHAIEALKEGQDRVESMALIHKDLYQQDNLKGVNIRDYLEQLVENLAESYQIDDKEIQIEMDIEPLLLDVDTMIPLGLLVNELLSNAFKHAFHEQETGKIHILLAEQENQLHIRVADNGQGVADIESFRKNSFGYSLIESFAKRLQADIQYNHHNGLEVSLDIRSYEKAA